MRYLSILIFIWLVSCSSKTSKETDNQKTISSSNLGKELIDAGFLRFADSIAMDSLKSELINSFDLYLEANNKIAHIDAEELAEFNFDFFVPTLNRVLQKRGFNLTVQVATDYESTHDILINGKKIQLYSKKELEDGTFWDAGARNFFREVNEQLTREEKEEVFYLLYAGNDLHAILLTPDQQRIIANNYRDTPMEIPYLP
ncbi:MAG: hypothetical protein RLO17_18585 [Cyclobacteriaceae bacterium]